MSELIGRCPSCYAATTLYYVDSVTVRCEYCAGKSYENVGRPTLPHDKYNSDIVYQIDSIVSQL